ncbi:MAG: helix-turn-helix domain-containing protein [Candidatus Thermoplasmatota archaeon]|nr:helix-turn-helix domain-containing protein [Candidatus Thermoplasmatota archaeon]
MMEAILAVKVEDTWFSQLRAEYDLDIRILDTVHNAEGERDLVEITLKNPKQSMEEVIETARKLPKVKNVEIDTLDLQRALAVVTVEHCKCCKLMRETDCFLLSARTSEAGWLEWNIIFTERPSLKKLVFGLEEMGCEVKLKKISTVDESKMLTAKQEDIIRTAYQRGYYDFPKRIGVRELAEMFDISTATLSEILRRGQKKIIERYLDLKPSK